MNDYRGTAELLDDNGSIIDTVQVYLRGRPATGVSLGEWGGHIEPSTFEGGDWMEAKRIRLRDGIEADIIVTNEQISGGSQGATRSGTIQGSGPLPF